jgi:hypothetical protein
VVLINLDVSQNTQNGSVEHGWDYSKTLSNHSVAHFFAAKISLV